MNEPTPMQGVLLVPGAWEPLLSGEAARAKAAAPIRARVDAANAALAEATLELANFHRAHCPDSMPISLCAVCMGRV
jgi:hypothetical protein